MDSDRFTLLNDRYCDIVGRYPYLFERIAFEYTRNDALLSGRLFFEVHGKDHNDVRHTRAS